MNGRTRGALATAVSVVGALLAVVGAAPTNLQARCPPIASIHASNPFGRTYQVDGADTWGDSVFATPEGYLVLGDHDVPGSFATNLTLFDQGGRPLRSYDPDIMPSWPKSARSSSDGGFLLTLLQEMDPRFKDEGRLIKLGPDLAVQWAKGVSSDGPVNATGLIETLDGGSITLLRDNRRLGILKLDADGQVAWKKSISPAASAETATAYSILENAYQDGAGKKQCGGYVLYGAVERPGTGWDLYLAALTCDGSSLLWQRIVSGPDWEASSWEGGLFMDYTTNLVVVRDGNGQNSQDADLLLVASTRSYGTGTSLLLVPFTVKGGLTLSDAPQIGPVQILDGPGDELVVGPYGGPNLFRLGDGNLIVGGETNDSAGLERALLAKLQPDLAVVWQYAYEAGSFTGLNEQGQNLLIAGGGPPGILLRLAPDGSGQGPCLVRTDPQLALSAVSPSIVDPGYTLQDGVFQVFDVTVTLMEVDVDLLCPGFHYMPTVLRGLP